jgi:hypothetical protein
MSTTKGKRRMPMKKAYLHARLKKQRCQIDSIKKTLCRAVGTSSAKGLAKSFGEESS